MPTHYNELKTVQEESSSNYAEGYVKGVHDRDAADILEVLVRKHQELGLLRYSPKTRAKAQFFWHSLPEELQQKFNEVLKSSGEVLSFFPDTKEYDFLIQQLESAIFQVAENSVLLSTSNSKAMANYLFEELQGDDQFQISGDALKIKEGFLKTLQEKQADLKFKNSYEKLDELEAKITDCIKSLE